ncbi:TRAP transporter small permease [Chachezhania antarctica]|uniref:TRAP transporter small permease n=1 Tax=Chachezhania antarctica TaxID=2340860 RepID=UPI000EB211F9|nr:TRAP transporter small permease [Chachezhania antarctica]|tara:strand:- start:9978 stop:10550 length:573 start_codon:yes stop_codon:yes gene_type:complete
MDPLNGPDRRAFFVPAWRKSRGVLGGMEKVFLTIAALMILAMSLYVATGIVLRTFFAGKLYDEVSIIGEMMVAAISLSFAYVAAERGFVAVEIFTNRAGRKARLWLDILASAVGLAALIPISIAAGKAGLRTWTEGSYFFGTLNLPEWPGYFVYIIGVTVFLLRLTDLIIHDLLCVLGVIEDDDPAHADL